MKPTTDEKPKAKPKPKSAKPKRDPSQNETPEPSKSSIEKPTTYVKTEKQENRRKAWMKFYRSLKKGSGTTRSEKCPDDVLAKIKTGKAESARYFDLWLGCDKNWGKVTLFEQKSKRQVSGQETITDRFTLTSSASSTTVRRSAKRWQIRGLKKKRRQTQMLQIPRLPSSTR